MTDAEKRYGAKPVSMGCLTEPNFCSVCGEVFSTCQHTKAAEFPETPYEPTQDDLMTPMLISVSLVPAPKCDDCGESMVPANDTEWMCEYDDCESKGVPRHTGIYPVRSVTGA